MMGYGYGGMEWMWLWMLAWLLLAVAGLAVLGFAVIKLVGAGSRRINSDASGANTARQILSERYARGEIDEDEYRKRRDALQ